MAAVVPELQACHAASTTTPAAGISAEGRHASAPPGAAAPLDVPELPLPLAVAEANPEDGGLPLSLTAVSSVPPRSGFEVRIRVRLPEARLLLVDAQGAIVPSGGTTEIADETRFTLTPTDPLRPGTGFELRLEGLASRTPHGSDGRAYEPLSLPFRTTGDPPSAPPRRQATRHRKAKAASGN